MFSEHCSPPLPCPSFAVIGHAIWEDIPILDDRPIKGRYKTMQGIDRYISLAPRPRFSSSLSPEAIKYLLGCQYWTALARMASTESHVDNLLLSIEKSEVPDATKLSFAVPFPLADILWTHPNSSVRNKSLTSLRIYEQSWRARPKNDELRHYCECLAFLVALSSTDSIPSELLVRRRGQASLRFVHEQIISCHLYQHSSALEKEERKLLMSEWTRATARARELGNLPPDCFVPIPTPTEDPSASPWLLDVGNVQLQTDIRYSQDTLTSVLDIAVVSNDETASANSSPDSGPVA
ncbi:hypothetical protein VNI00_010774 [Paramarasmius palmivorus]|uniref:Uncharacterized protein n=1 Tax=Paramarasmius palmivorus TaxID=297713 RepID=A0AAW0CIG6_9AGAR